MGLTFFPVLWGNFTEMLHGKIDLRAFSLHVLYLVILPFTNGILKAGQASRFMYWDRGMVLGGGFLQ